MTSRHMMTKDLMKKDSHLILKKIKKSLNSCFLRSEILRLLKLLKKMIMKTKVILLLLRKKLVKKWTLTSTLIQFMKSGLKLRHSRQGVKQFLSHFPWLILMLKTILVSMRWLSSNKLKHISQLEIHLISILFCQNYL